MIVTLYKVNQNFSNSNLTQLNSTVSASSSFQILLATSDPSIPLVIVVSLDDAPPALQDFKAVKLTAGSTKVCLSYGSNSTYFANANGKDSLISETIYTEETQTLALFGKVAISATNQSLDLSQNKSLNIAITGDPEALLCPGLHGSSGTGTTGKSFVNVSVQILEVSCLSWEEGTEQWLEDGCQVFE